MTSDFALEVAM